MPLRLNQVNAILTGRKPDVEKTVGEVYKLVQKDGLFAGRTRVYRPFDEDKGQKFPPENQKVQHRVSELLSKISKTWKDIWDLTLTQDFGNMSATADIVVDDVTVLSGVPVTSLLYLDKQVNDLVTFIEKLPTPDQAEEWVFDPNSRLLRTGQTESVRTSKEPTVIVRYEATDKHPAQTELFTKDVAVGTWTQTLLSGALPAVDKETYLVKARKLHSAIKEAREKANMQQVEKRDAGDLLKFVFGPSVLD